RYIGKILAIPVHYLAPAIMFLTIVGSYAIRNNIIDVAFLIVFGSLGYILKKVDIHPAPIVLGLILGHIAEERLTQAMIMASSSGNIFMLFLSRPISVALMILFVLAIIFPFIGKLFFKNRMGNVEPE